MQTTRRGTTRCITLYKSRSVTSSRLAADTPPLHCFTAPSSVCCPCACYRFVASAVNLRQRVDISTLDVRAAPMYRGAVHPVFVREYVSAIQISRNLVSFTCTQSAIVPQSLDAIHGHSNIRSIRITAKLSPDSSAVLSQLEALDSITLDASTWNVIDMLPRWLSPMSRSLTSLTLYVSFSVLSAHENAHPRVVFSRIE